MAVAARRLTTAVEVRVVYVGHATVLIEFPWMRVLTDPADCGPATLALPQDVQTEAYDYPETFFRPRSWRWHCPARSLLPSR